MSWPLVISLLVVLMAATPFIQTFRCKADWVRHPGGGGGVLRDNIVMYTPNAGFLTVALFAISMKTLGVLSITDFRWIAAGLIALLALSALAGFLPPVMAARQRLLRLRYKPEA